MKHYTGRAMTEPHLQHLASQIKTWGAELGFQQVGIAAVELAESYQRQGRSYKTLMRSAKLPWLLSLAL